MCNVHRLKMQKCGINNEIFITRYIYLMHEIIIKLVNGNNRKNQVKN